MRSKNSFLTMITGMIAIAITGVLGFLKIRFFIDGLGSDANGLIQMIYRILGYLSLAELGLGSALIYKLYKPLATKDEQQISKLMTTATHFFNRVGYIILVFLFVFMFFLPLIIKNNLYDNWFLYLTFVLAGLPYAIEYIWYKKYYIIICADQKQYIINIIFHACTILYDILIIFALLNGIDLIQYILLSYPFVLLKGIALQWFYKKKYPYVTKSKSFDKESLKMSKDVFLHNIGSLINNNSDQIVLSIFKGLTFVSIYSSYIYIVKYLRDITSAILKSTSHSFGNLFADENKINNEGYIIYREYLSFSSFFSIIITSTFYFGIIPFINLWIGDPKYILGLGGILAFTVMVYSNIITIPLNIAISSNGIFKQTKYYSFIAALTNIILSILLIQKYQIAGIVFATVASTMLIWFPLTMNVIYKEVFTEHKKKDYYIEILKSLIIIIFIIIIINIFNFTSFYQSTILGWIIVSSVFFIIISVIMSIYYYIVDKYYKNFIHRCFNLIRRKKVK